MLVVKSRHTPVNRAASLEPYVSISLGEIAGEALDVVKWATWFFVVALRTECGDVSVDPVAAKGHPWHMMIL
jgi:hypothetical protein